MLSVQCYTLCLQLLFIPVLLLFRILQVARNATVTSIPIMCLYIKLSPQPTERAWINSSVTLSFVDPSKPENVIVSPISRTANNQYFPKRDGYLGYEFVTSWPQQVCVANFAIPVVYRKCKLRNTIQTCDKTGTVMVSNTLSSHNFQCLHWRMRSRLHLKMDICRGNWIPRNFSGPKHSRTSWSNARAPLFQHIA